MYTERVGFNQGRERRRREKARGRRDWSRLKREGEGEKGGGWTSREESSQLINREPYNPCSPDIFESLVINGVENGELQHDMIGEHMLGASHHVLHLSL